jgi:hypothetical protein
VRLCEKAIGQMKLAAAKPAQDVLPDRVPEDFPSGVNKKKR